MWTCASPQPAPCSLLRHSLHFANATCPSRRQSIRHLINIIAICIRWSRRVPLLSELQDTSVLHADSLMGKVSSNTSRDCPADCSEPWPCLAEDAAHAVEVYTLARGSPTRRPSQTTPCTEVAAHTLVVARMLHEHGLVNLLGAHNVKLA